MGTKQKSISKGTAQIGLFSSITILVSAVVGIGIFFKNQSILGNNHGNGWGVLISWIIAMVITLTTAIAFAEIISADEKHDGSGLAGWASKICGHRIGRFILISMPLFYFTLKLVDTSFFTGEGILLIANSNNPGRIAQHTWFLVLVGFAIMIIFIGINAISTRAAKTISLVATVMKFLPLIVVGISGIILGILSGFSNSLFTPGTLDPTNPQTTHGNISILGIFASLPALLFTFDSFLTIGNAASSMKKPHRNVPLAILIGIPIVAVLYLLVTIGQLLTGQQNVYKFVEYMINYCGGNKNAVIAGNAVVGSFIMISLLGSANAFSLTAIRSLKSAIDQDIIIGSIKIKKIANGRNLHIGAFYGAVFGTIICAIMAIPTIIMNSDAPYDGVSNLPTLFFFVIYGLVIAYGLINHYNNKVKVSKMKVFPIVATIAIIGCTFAFGYNLLYEFTTRNFVNNAPVSWGMFKGEKISRSTASILVWALFILFLTLPFINDLCIHTFRKSHSQKLIWQ